MVISLAQDIRPLFTEMDIPHMTGLGVFLSGDNQLSGRKGTVSPMDWMVLPLTGERSQGGCIV